MSSPLFFTLRLRYFFFNPSASSSDDTWYRLFCIAVNFRRH
jgi:hypothetical protein